MSEISDISDYRYGKTSEEIADEFRPLNLQLEDLKKLERRRQEISKELEKKSGTLYEQMRIMAESRVGGRRSEEASAIKTTLVGSFRELWQVLRRDDEVMKVSMALVHGIIERSDDVCIEAADKWLWGVYRAVLEGSVQEAHELERKARSLGCGLRVLDPERDPVACSGFFGIVREIEEGEARLSISIPQGRTDRSAPLWESFTVSAVELPERYAVEGAWVAWLERSYNCNGSEMKKGRFEPASLLVPEKNILQNDLEIVHLHGEAYFK